MQERYLGWEKVSCLERCPQFRGVLIEGFHCIPIPTIAAISKLTGVRSPLALMIEGQLSTVIEVCTRCE